VVSQSADVLASAKVRLATAPTGARFLFDFHLSVVLALDFDLISI
jgi:hypothetical protein